MLVSTSRFASLVLKIGFQDWKTIYFSQLFKSWWVLKKAISSSRFTVGRLQVFSGFAAGAHSVFAQENPFAESDVEYYTKANITTDKAKITSLSHSLSESSLVTLNNRRKEQFPFKEKYELRRYASRDLILLSAYALVNEVIF